MLSSNAKDELQVFFFVFSQSLLIWEKKSTYNGNQVKKRNHAMTANLFNVILPEKDQWHILTFGPKTERVSRCWSLMWKKVHKNIGISQTPSCNISLYWCGKWWILLLRENAEFWFKDVQNAWIHFWNRFTFKSHSSFLVFENALSESDPKKKCWLSFLCYPKILAQNSRFTKKCWISVESPASWSDEKFSSALRRVKISIQHTLLTLISTECWGITQI